jgi:hypothetical protein
MRVKKYGAFTKQFADAALIRFVEAEQVVIAKLIDDYSHDELRLESIRGRTWTRHKAKA